MMVMVTSPSDQFMLRSRGLETGASVWVAKFFFTQRCQFRGDWSQGITSFTSKSQSNIFAREEMQRHLSYYIFSLTMDTNHVSKNPRVLKAEPDLYVHRRPVRVNIFLYFWLIVIPSPLWSPVNCYSEERRPMANVGVYSYISTKDC